MTIFFNCNECDFFCFNSMNLLIHIKNHQAVNLYKCFDCNYLSDDPVNIFNHIMDHSKTYKCFCNFVCKDSITFLNHQIAHKNVNPYKCFSCDYSCKEIENLKIHLKDHFECNSTSKIKNHSRCNSGDNVKNRLRSRLQPKSKKRLRSYSRKFKCKYIECNYIAKRKYDLKRHTKSHENNTVRKCHLNIEKVHICNYSRCTRYVTN